MKIELLTKRLLAALCAALAGAPLAQAQSCAAVAGAANAPLVIGHRGAPGYLPEHTLASYQLAIDLGADYIETDLVSTRDGVLVARHEPNLINTTDVSRHPEFAARRRTVQIDGVAEEGFFASDFTLAEIRTLRAVQAFADRDHSFDGRFRIATLDEILLFVKQQSQRTGRRIGFYVETKHPSYHQALGLPLEDKLLAALKQAGYTSASAPVFIESFEVANLKYLHARTPLRLIQLVDGSSQAADGTVQLAPPSERPYDFVLAQDARTYRDLLTPAGLKEVATYAAGIGPWKAYLLPSRCAVVDARGGCEESQRTLLAPTRIVEDAHAAGLLVHPFTFRSEPRRLLQDYGADPLAEYRRFYALGVDGVFTDFANHAVLARSLCALEVQR
ncbi:MAG: glycerophosphodiester phosphodiesterase [Steroidobacteraceae bacterium]